VSTPNQADKGKPGLVVWIECEQEHDVRQLSRALGIPDLLATPGWKQAPDGTALLILRAEYVESSVERRAHVALRVPERS